jgi:hypothetical protein
LYQILCPPCSLPVLSISLPLPVYPLNHTHVLFVPTCTFYSSLFPCSLCINVLYILFTFAYYLPSCTFCLLVLLDPVTACTLGLPPCFLCPSHHFPAVEPFSLSMYSIFLLRWLLFLAFSLPALGVSLSRLTYCTSSSLHPPLYFYHHVF